ncbi:ABC transporter permease [Clostridium subterminale]|uniref:ABC transporter permease n=1 Tax=Clostridium subterminale TaxID=1550 RepID=A0ABN1KY57_CLOSU
MLRKLMKYEFKATGRIMLPLYGALLGFSIINKIFIGTNLDEVNMDFLGGVPAVITMIGYFVTMVAVFVGTLFITLQRFYKNLFGDEGYLMNTIPVKSSQNIVNKLIVSIVWTIISGLIAAMSIFVMAYQPGALKEIIREFKNIYPEIGLNIIGIIEFIIFGIVSLAHQIMMLYASLSIGQLFKSKKLLGGFAGFMILSIAQQSIIGIGITMLIATGNYINISPQYAILCAIIVCLIFFTILFCITNYIMKNKLNLE